MVSLRLPRPEPQSPKSKAFVRSAAAASRVPSGARFQRCSMSAVIDVVSYTVESTYHLRAKGEMTMAGTRVPGRVGGLCVCCGAMGRRGRGMARHPQKIPPHSKCSRMERRWTESADQVGSGYWRVPSYKELLTLVDESPHQDYVQGLIVAIDANAFPSTPASQFWTSSLDPMNPTQAYAVDFGTGVGSLESVMFPLFVRRVQ